MLDFTPCTLNKHISYLMNSRTNSDNGLILNLITISVLCDEVLGVDFGFVIEIANDRNYVCNVEHLNVIFVGRDNNADVSFGCFD